MGLHSSHEATPARNRAANLLVVGHTCWACTAVRRQHKKKSTTGQQPASFGPHLLAVGCGARDVLKQVGQVARLHLRHVLNVALRAAGNQDAMILKPAWAERKMLLLRRRLHLARNLALRGVKGRQRRRQDSSRQRGGARQSTGPSPASLKRRSSRKSTSQAAPTWNTRKLRALTRMLNCSSRRLYCSHPTARSLILYCGRRR